MSIPISYAKTIAEECGLAGVLLVGIRGEKAFDVTTYGTAADDKVISAAVGDAVQHVLAAETWKIHSDFRDDFDAGLFREALDLLAMIRGRNDGSPHTVRQAERILNAAGRGVRSGG